MSAAELPPPPGPIVRVPTFSGDALARLLQLEAWKCGIDGWRGMDKGVQAVPQLMLRIHNAEMHVKELETALKTVHEQITKCTNLEGCTAVVTIAILRAKTNYDLQCRTWESAPA